MIYTFIEPALLARTIERLSPGRVLVHVDAKVDERPFRSMVRPLDRSRVEFVRPRHRVNWAGYSQIRAIRTLLARALEVTDPDDYVVMMSGQDYPLRPGHSIDEFLRSSGGRQFLRYFRIDESDDAYRTQFYERHFRDLPLLSHRPLSPRLRKVRTASVLTADLAGHMLPRKAVPAGLTPCFGPTHFAITASFARYLDAMVTEDVEDFFKTTFCPEELLYQTLAASGPKPVLNGAPRPDGSEPFTGRGNWRYANLHHIDPTLIKVYTAADWDEVRASDKLFLRKLKMSVSSDLLDQIDSMHPTRS